MDTATYSNILVPRVSHLVAELDENTGEAVTVCGDVRSITTVSSEPLFDICPDCAAA